MSEIDPAEAEAAKIKAQVDRMMDAWKWRRDEEVKTFPPKIQACLLKDWEPGKL